MGMNQCRLAIAEEGMRGGPIRFQTFGDTERLEVRDLSTRTTVMVPAKEISAYRHNLLLEGKTYRILNVIKLS